MIEVLKQALDALETEVSIDWTNNDEFNASAEKMHDAITSLQQAIAQLESEKPVGYAVPSFDFDNSIIYKVHYEHTVPLYTHPPQRTWVGLTNNELQPIADEYRILFGGWVEDFARAIEAKLKEKNT